jgi:hypothetical protein
VVTGILAAAAILAAAELGQTSRAPDERSSTAAADSIASSTEVAYATAPALPAGSAGHLLIARTWTNVRKSRSKSAGLEAVLLPGDTVLADSLARGWYRVALEGEVLGYVHRSTLTAGGER